MSYTKQLTRVKVLILAAILIAQSHANQIWDHAVYLNDDYLLQWTVKEPDILFEVQVKAHGYVGFGFSRDGTTIYGADVFIGWIDEGHIFFYDCHIKTHSSTGEPVVDTSQDYVLLSGSENATHTILRFRRKLNTCDDKSDVPITNDTMNVIFLYHSEKPKRGQIKKDSLPDPMMAIHPLKSLLLLQRSSQKKPDEVGVSGSESLEIRTEKVQLSESSPLLLKWCHTHKLKANRHSQIVRFEPLFSPPDSRRSISFMRIYECKTPIDNLASSDEEECSEPLKMDRKCFTVMATWSSGSEGFSYPKDVGYSISDTTDHLLLEVHYQHNEKANLEDSSGFRVFFTPNRRKFDAGTLSIAIRPNFLHIIAPGFKRVISVAHCTSDCTQKALTPEGINVFGINMQTHSLGRKIKVGIARSGEEIEPIAQESNLNFDYSENRVFEKVKKVLPGDHITVECTYNTFARKQFTLGGESNDEEVCTATLMYYPRQEQLVSCYSQSNIAILLKALGIENLGKSGDQMVIKSPQKYAGRTLEGHLRLYDWKNEFYTFERTIKTSTFDGMCNSAFVPSKIVGLPPNITRPFRPPDQICPPAQVNTSYKLIRPDNDIDENLIEDGEKGKAIRSNPSTFSLELYSSSATIRLSFLSCFVVCAAQLARMFGA